MATPKLTLNWNSIGEPAPASAPEGIAFYRCLPPLLLILQVTLDLWAEACQFQDSFCAWWQAPSPGVGSGHLGDTHVLVHHVPIDMSPGKWLLHV